MKNKETENFANELKKSYYKNWRNNNKDKIKRYNSNYWNKKAKRVINDISNKDTNK